LPGIPLQMKVHIPLKCKRINMRILIDFPSVHHFRLIAC
jgi:hypothetical protein